MSIHVAAAQPPADSALLDLTGKARIRHAALQLFASKGYAQASLRRIAQRANVSLALIGHHFGSKLLLREAIDAWVVRRLGEVAKVDLRASLADAAAQLVRGYQAVLDVEPDMRTYLRRTVLEDVRGEAPILALLLDQIRQVLGQTPDALRATAPDALAPWSAQVFVQVVGPLVLEPALRRDRARHAGREPQPMSASDEAVVEERRSFAPVSGGYRSHHADTALAPLGRVQAR
jgi:TetR/AcrR family transcriptional regulator, regulator of cefoperazone and chloramphenicol sensitivity